MELLVKSRMHKLRIHAVDCMCKRQTHTCTRDKSSTKLDGQRNLKPNHASYYDTNQSGNDFSRYKCECPAKGLGVSRVTWPREDGTKVRIELNSNRLSRPAVAMNLIKTVANNSNKARLNFHARGNTRRALNPVREIYECVQKRDENVHRERERDREGEGEKGDGRVRSDRWRRGRENTAALRERNTE